MHLFIKKEKQKLFKTYFLFKRGNNANHRCNLQRPFLCSPCQWRRVCFCWPKSKSKPQGNFISHILFPYFISFYSIPSIPVSFTRFIQFIRRRMTTDRGASPLCNALNYLNKISCIHPAVPPGRKLKLNFVFVWLVGRFLGGQLVGRFLFWMSKSIAVVLSTK